MHGGAALSYSMPNTSYLKKMNTFQWNRIRALIIAAALVVVALVMLQAKWLLHAKNLNEEQFNQKVSMALCMTVTELGHGKSICAAPNPIPEPVLDAYLPNPISTSVDEQSLRAVLDKHLSLFDIPLDYEVSIQDKTLSCSTNSPSCCSMKNVAGFEDHYLYVSFPNRTKYVLGKMGLMIGASIVILLFVCSVLWVAISSLIQQKMIGERNKDFFNNMAHEFKTPLTNIKLAIGLLQKKSTPAKEARYTKIIRKETENLSHQVERVLHLSNLEKGVYELSIEVLPLAALLREVLEEMTIQIQDKQATVGIQIPANLTIKGDAFHLKNAFRNLIDNALKYSSQQPQLQITCQQKETGIHLLFEDNGIGITKADQHLIFDKFQRVSTGDLHNQKGFGLGLAYVKKVMELHKGFIEIISELGKGSRFDLFLPY